MISLRRKHPIRTCDGDVPRITVYPKLLLAAFPSLIESQDRTFDYETPLHVFRYGGIIPTVLQLLMM
ncbi:hypothetical protein D3C77_632940 [compost metagenome]